MIIDQYLLSQPHQMSRGLFLIFNILYYIEAPPWTGTECMPLLAYLGSMDGLGHGILSAQRKLSDEHQHGQLIRKISHPVGHGAVGGMVHPLYHPPASHWLATWKFLTPHPGGIHLNTMPLYIFHHVLLLTFCTSFWELDNNVCTWNVIYILAPNAHLKCLFFK